MSMQEPCFVVALPRSRTAWMAAWLDIPHELMDGCYSNDDFVNRCKAGASDTFLAWFPIREYYSNAPVLVIKRDVDDVMVSLGKLLKPEDMPVIRSVLEDTSRRMDEIEGAMIVKYEDVNSKLEAIWKHLKGTEFDSSRAEMFKNMNIQLISIAGDSKTFDRFVRR